MTDPVGNGNGVRPTLERFRLRHFRSFEDVEIVLEPDITVLVGRNDVGKSSLLDALWFYGAIGKRGFRFVAQNPDLVGGQAPVLSASWRDPASGQAYEHTLVCDPKEPSEYLKWPEAECRWDPRRRRLSCAGQEFDARGIRRLTSLGTASVTDWRGETDVPDDLSEHLGLVSRFATPVPYLFEPSSLALGVPLNIDTVYRSGAGWVILLQDIINRRDHSLEKLEEITHRLFPFFRRVTVVEERYEVIKKVTGLDEQAMQSGEYAVPDGGVRLDLADFAQSQSQRRLRFEVECPRTDLLGECRWVPAGQMSSGLLLALAYLTVAVSSPPGSLLALEEPENGLNQVVTSNMMEAFLEIVGERKHQLLMTTHNGFWLDYVGPHRIRVVTRDDAGSHVMSDPENFERIRDEGLYLSEVMALGGPEQLLEQRRGSRP